MSNKITTIPHTIENPRSDLQPLLSRNEEHVVERHITSLEPIATMSQLPACRAEAPSEGRHPVTIIMATGSSVQSRASRPHIRNGKIARLPKLERDMVNRMLYNNVPYSKIVAALGELEIKATERNISNWKTRGGYKEWCAEQERQLQLSLLQDHLTDYLRKNDPSQLPEVGLQVAATQLSSMLLQPEAAQQLAADPKKYSEVVDMLCRLSTQINALQKDRDQAVKKAAIRGTSEHCKHEDEKTVEEIRLAYSSKIGKGPKDPDVPHRNDFRRRDELPFQEPAPKPPTVLEILKGMHKTRPSVPGVPASQPKPAENTDAS